MLMQRRSIPFRFALPSVALVALLIPALPSQAQSTKDRLTDLTDQVKILTDMTQRLQSTVDSKFGVLQHLVEQSTDSVNQMNAAVASMQQKLNAQTENSNGKLDGVSGQVQSLNDSVDEMKSRIGKLDKQLQDIQAQLQTIQSQPAGAPTGGTPQPGQPLPGSGSTDPNQPPAPDAGQAQAPPLKETYQSALRDYNAAHYDVASSEFGDVLHYYPHDDLAGNAQFYLGEIAYKQQKFRDAIKAYNAVLEDSPGNPKSPAAQLRKGLALIQLNQKDSGVHELRSLIQRYPQSPEALQARSKLNAMGIRVAPR